LGTYSFVNNSYSNFIEHFVKLKEEGNGQVSVTLWMEWRCEFLSKMKKIWMCLY